MESHSIAENWAEGSSVLTSIFIGLSGCSVTTIFEQGKGKSQGATAITQVRHEMMVF